MAKALILFVNSDERESQLLKDRLESKLGTRVNLTTAKEAIAEDSSLQNELTQSCCVVLVNSKQSSEFIKQKTQEKEGSYVLFDGKLIQEQLNGGNLLAKLVVVQFGNAKSTTIVPDGYDREVFVLDPNFNATDAVLDQIEDRIKGFLSSKVKPKEKKEEKNCTVL